MYHSILGNRCSLLVVLQLREGVHQQLDLGLSASARILSPRRAFYEKRSDRVKKKTHAAPDSTRRE